MGAAVSPRHARRRGDLLLRQALRAQTPPRTRKAVVAGPRSHLTGEVPLQSEWDGEPGDRVTQQGDQRAPQSGHECDADGEQERAPDLLYAPDVAP
jgi:hypothetical protein